MAWPFEIVGFATEVAEAEGRHIDNPNVSKPLVHEQHEALVRVHLANFAAEVLPSSQRLLLLGHQLALTLGQGL